MWYLIQTEEGKEQELVDAVRDSAEEEARQIGERCFLLRRETVWRREGRCIPHVETLFPGCVFAEEDGKEDFAGRLERALRNLKTERNTEINAEENYRPDEAVSDLSGSLTDAAEEAENRTAGKAEAIASATAAANDAATADSAATADAMSKVNSNCEGSSGISGAATSPSDARLRGEAFIASGIAADRKTESGSGKKEESSGSGKLSDGVDLADHVNGGPISHSDTAFRIHPMRKEDQRILEQLLDGDRERIVRLSPVEVDEEDAEKRIIGCGGALRHYQKDIVKKRIRLRYVVVRLPFLGGLRDVLLGIRLKGDEGAPEEATAGMA